MNDKDQMGRALAMRTSLLQDGLDLRVTPSMLKRFGLAPWDGMFLGMVCVESPIITGRE